MQRNLDTSYLTALNEFPFKNNVTQFLSLRDHMSVCFTSHRLFTLNQDDSRWRTLYARDFFKPLFEQDYKAQYIAQFLYQKAISAKRIDQIYYYSNKLLEYINENGYRRRPWAKFFLGFFSYQADGDDQDNLASVFCLHQSVCLGDFCAAQFVAANIDNPIFERVFKKNPIEPVRQCLLTAYQNKQILNVSPEIAYLYALENNLEETLRWTKQALAHSEIISGPYLAKIFAIFVTAGNPFPKEAQEILASMKCLFETSSSGELACQIGTLYMINMDWDPSFKLAREWFEKCKMLGHGEGTFKLGHMYANGYAVTPNREIAIECYTKSAGFGCVEGINELVSIQNENGNMDPGLYKAWFCAGNAKGAITLSEKFREEKGWEENPHHVAWVQAAAQSECKNSMDALQKLRLTNSPFARIAFALIISLGYLRIPELTPLIPKLVTEITSQLKPSDLAKYRNTLQQEGLLEPYMEALFIAWEKALVPKAEFKISGPA